MLHFVLPAYNEEKDLPQLFDEFLAVKFPFPYRILVVDDGSSDGTAAVIERYRKSLPIDVVAHGKNKGLGQALLTGFTTVARRIGKDDIVVTMDSDGTHPLDATLLIKEKIEAGRDVVIASRFVAGGREQGLSAFRKLLSHTASSGLRVLWPIKNVRDYSCGYRGYSAALIEDLYRTYGDRMIEESGFSSTLELLLKASLLTDRFDEVPLDLRYDRKQGESKMQVKKTVFRYFRLIARLKLLKSKASS